MGQSTRGRARHKMWLLALTLISLLSVHAIDIANEFIDEEADAVVVEALKDDEGSERSGRQFSFSTGQYPASTIPLAPMQSANLLCRTPSGSLTFCQNFRQYPWGGVGGQYPPGVGGGFPGGFPGYPPQQGGGGGQWQQPPQQPYPPQQVGGGGQWQQPPQQPYPPQQVGGGGQWQQPQQPVTHPTHPPFITHPPSPQPTQPPAYPTQPPAYPTQPPAQTQGPPQTAPVVAEETDDSSSGSAGNYPARCGVGKYYPIRYNGNGTVAEEQERIDNDGQHPFRVVNGWPADKYEWPWIAALLNNGRQFCGGSLITQKHILTAAHCVAHMSRYDVANLKVRLGDYEIKTVGETDIFESKAARVVRHKEFSQQTLHKDVAIITLENPVPTNMAHVHPVCLPSGHQKYAGQTATVIGWGSLKENGPQPNTLMEVTVKIWDNPTCKDTYGNAAPGGIMDHMLCAGQKGKDSCSGDSGGPMQIGSGDTWTQIGVVSWGIGCGKSHYPGVYSRVTELRDWIDRIVKEY